MLGSQQKLRITFNVNNATNHLLFYEIRLDENLIKKFSGVGLPTLLSCSCYAYKCFGTNNGTKISSRNFKRNNNIYQYTSLNNAYTTIYNYLVTKVVPFPSAVNYLDAIEYHNGTNWQPINNLLPW
jgi:hypothetical protein